MPLFLRISATDWLEEETDMESWKVEDTVKLAEVLADMGVDLLDVSSGGLHPKQRVKTGPGTYMLEFINSTNPLSQTPAPPPARARPLNPPLTHSHTHSHTPNRLPIPLRQSRQGKTQRQTSRRHRRDHHERETGPAIARRGRRSRSGHRRPDVPEEPGARVDVRRGAGGADQHGESDPLGVRRAGGGGKEEEGGGGG